MQLFRVSLVGPMLYIAIFQLRLLDWHMIGDGLSVFAVSIDVARIYTMKWPLDFCRPAFIVLQVYDIVLTTQQLNLYFDILLVRAPQGLCINGRACLAFQSGLLLCCLAIIFSSTRSTWHGRDAVQVCMCIACAHHASAFQACTCCYSFLDVGSCIAVECMKFDVPGKEILSYFCLLLHSFYCMVLYLLLNT